MSNSRNSIWLFTLVVVLSAPIWWYPLSTYLTPRYDDILHNDQAPSVRRFVMKYAVLNQYVNSRRQWQVKADKVTSSETEGDLKLQKVKAVLYDEEGREKSRFSGNEGLYEKKKELLTLTGRAVVFMKESGWTLKSEILSYNIKSQKVYSSTAVSVVGRDVKVKGKNLRYDMKSKFLRINGRVKCDIS